MQREKHLSDEMPSVSIILPFNPKMTSKSTIGDALGKAVRQITSELNNRYPGVLVALVLEKLKAALAGLNYSTHKNSIAVYISPFFEKVLYLDLAVEERIAVSNRFDIRDIVYSKAKTQKLLLLALSAENTSIFSMEENGLTRIVSNQVAGADICERVRRIDHSLGILLPVYEGPLFVAGSRGRCEEFKSHTRYAGEVLDYFSTTSQVTDIAELTRLLRPVVDNIDQLKKKKIVKYLADAEHNDRLMKGVENISKAGRCVHGSLLVVENGYVDMNGAMEASSKTGHPNLNAYSYINNPVDDLIEKALLNGGDVEFVAPGILPGNEHIALIEHLY